MARPVNANADETRRRIRDTALELFSDHGMRGVSIRSIASTAGVSLAMVHHYFGSKDGLYDACIDAMYDELRALRPALVAAVRDASARDDAGALELVVRECFRFARARREIVRLLMRSIVSAGELAPRHRDAVQLPFLREMSELIAAVTGRPAAALRLPLQSLSALLTRYALGTDRELTLLADVDDPEIAVAAVEDHIVDAAHALLGVRPPQE